MGHIFISYSHKDSSYVHKLAEALQKEGFEVWIDDRIHYGSEWPKVVTRNLDVSDGVIIVLSNNSYDSDMVHNEVTRAREKKKPIFPLLLEGENWLIVQAKQFVDVRDGSLPTEKFYKRLEEITSRKKERAEREAAKKIGREKAAREKLEYEATEKAKREKAGRDATAKPSKTQTSQKRIFNTTSFISVMAIIFCIASVTLIPLLGSLNKKSETTPTSQIKLTNTVQVISSPSSTSMVNETPSLTPTQIITFTPGSLPTEITDAKGVSMTLVEKNFYMDKYEVTNALYKACVESGVCLLPTNANRYVLEEYSSHPVVYVNQDMAETYCQWREARLPTGSEWEIAAGSNVPAKFPWGDDNDCKYANIAYGISKGQYCVGTTTPVGSYELGKSVFNIYDLIGNVWEWTTGGFRLHGGGWSTYQFLYEDPLSVEWTSNTIGFRCAKGATP